MGQASSQLQPPAARSPIREQRGKTKGKKPRLKKGKKKSSEIIQSLDQEEESARALMQMREDAINDNRATHQDDDIAASTQLLAESSPVPLSGHSNTDHRGVESIRKGKDRRQTSEKGKRRRRQRDIFSVSSSEEPNNENPYPHSPSTPPGQIDRSTPPPFHPILPQANHALDDIPTDDDEVAAYQEYAKDTLSTDPSGNLRHEVHSFSQQLADDFAPEQSDNHIQSGYQLPSNVYPSPGPVANSTRKRKRQTAATLEYEDEERQSFANHEGQRNPVGEFEVALDPVDIVMNSSEQGQDDEAQKMPIDPELHSINALARSAGHANLNNGGQGASKKNKKSGHGKCSSSQPKKRRRLEEMRSTITRESSYKSPYAFQHDQENVQDRVLPGFEDTQRRTSPELGSTLVGDIEDVDSNLSSEGSKSGNAARRKEKGGLKKSKTNHKKIANETAKETEHGTKDKAEIGGPFSATEASKLDIFRDRYCEVNDMPIWQFNNLIQTPMRGNAVVTELFNELHEILHSRPRISVQRFCRRRFHNFAARGTWTADEDAMLKRAVAEKGKAWKEVGEMIDRMPEDCRDRWRNYLVNSEHRNREQWTDAEVRNLGTAILECMRLIKEDRARARDNGETVPESEGEPDQEVEDMKHINWQAVSDRMGEHGGGRSRLQCSFKWGQLKKKEQAGFLRDINMESESQKSTPGKNPWRQKLASKKVANMKPREIDVFLQAILATGVPEEGNIPWKSLGTDDFRATWTATDKKAAWSTLKNRVQGSELMDYRDVVNSLISQLPAEDANGLDEKRNPEVFGDVNAGRPVKSKRKQSRQNKGKGKGKDTDMINAAFDTRDYNRRTLLPTFPNTERHYNALSEAEPSTVNQGNLGMKDGDVDEALAGRIQLLANA